MVDEPFARSRRPTPDLVLAPNEGDPIRDRLPADVLWEMACYIHGRDPRDGTL